MDNNIRNFYEEETRYANLVLETKKIVEFVIDIDVEKLSKKIEKVNIESTFDEYINLLEAVIGKDTTNFYYCKNQDDQKHHGLVVGNVYGRDVLDPEIQSRIQKPSRLELPARILLANFLYDLTLKLKKVFSENLQTVDGYISTIEEDLIVKKDIDTLDNLMKYLDILLNEQGKLRIIAAEQEVFALNKAKEQYQKKSSLEKWFLKTLKQEDSTLKNMAKKNKEKK